MTLPCPLIETPMYLGKPGAMQSLGTPESGYSSIGSRGEAIHTAISGATSVTRVPDTKRIWTLPKTGMTEDAANLFVAFYAGAMGLGPFVLVDPAWRNKLGANASSMGAVRQAITGWSAAAGTLAFDPSDAAAQFPESGVMSWTGAGSGSKLGLGNWVSTTLVPRTAEAPVYLSDQPSAGGIYIRAVSGSPSITYQLNGVDASGVVKLAGTSQGTTASTTGWTRLESFLAAGSTTALYIIPTITCNTASAPKILFCCADLQYGVTSSPNTIQPWVLGLGSPRIVLVPSSSGGGLTATTVRLPYRDHAFTLAEAA